MNTERNSIDVNNELKYNYRRLLLFSFFFYLFFSFIPNYINEFKAENDNQEYFEAKQEELTPIYQVKLIEKEYLHFKKNLMKYRPQDLTKLNSIQVKLVISPEEVTTLGGCKDNLLAINKNQYIKLPSERLPIIYHELGHCIYNYEHRESEIMSYKSVKITDKNVKEFFNVEQNGYRTNQEVSTLAIIPMIWQNAKNLGGGIHYLRAIEAYIFILFIILSIFKHFVIIYCSFRLISTLNRISDLRYERIAIEAEEANSLYHKTVGE